MDFFSNYRSIIDKAICDLHDVPLYVFNYSKQKTFHCQPEETAEQIEALAESMKRYKELRRRQKEYRRGLGHSVVVVSQATAGGATSNAISIDSDHVSGENGDHSSKDDKAVPNGTNKVRQLKVLLNLTSIIAIQNNAACFDP